VAVTNQTTVHFDRSHLTCDLHARQYKPISIDSRMFVSIPSFQTERFLNLYSSFLGFVALLVTDDGCCCCNFFLVTLGKLFTGVDVLAFLLVIVTGDIWVSTADTFNEFDILDFFLLLTGVCSTVVAEVCKETAIIAK
jgi:hypothetical protein